MLLAPLSMASGTPLDQIAKYLRLGTSVAIVLLGLTIPRSLKLLPASSGLVGFTVFFTLSGFWSDLPQWALFYKGMFTLTILSGLILANVVRDPGELWKGLRVLGLVAGFGGAFTFLMYLRNPQASTAGGRLAIMGINANMLGMTAAALLILCAFQALYEQRRSWKLFSYVSGALLGITLLGSGSRGSILMGSAGCFLVSVPIFQHPSKALGVALSTALLGWGILELSPRSGLIRLDQDLTKDTREGIWNYAEKKFLEAPIVGHGWLHYGTSWGAVQSTYLQIAVETGLVGLGVFSGFLLLLGSRVIRVWKSLRRVGTANRLAYLGIGLTGAVLLHSLAESATIMGSTLNALLLGLGVGLIDRIPEFAAQEAYTDWFRYTHQLGNQMLTNPIPTR